MCTEVNVVIGDQVIACETVGELSAALGLPLAAITRYDNPEAGDCLCSARWDELGARKATEDEGFPFPEYVIVRPNSTIHSPHTRAFSYLAAGHAVAGLKRLG